MDKNIEKDGTQAVTEQENVRTPVSKNVNTKAAVFNKNLNEETIHTDASASTLAEFLIHQDEYVKKQHEKKDFAGEEAAEYQKLIDKVKTYITDKTSLEAIREAYELADKAHSGQIRATGEPYIVHPLAVAYILAELEIDTQGIIAALLHDVVEDTDYTLDDIKMLFGDEVAFLVDGVTKLSQFHYKDKEDQQLENFRKMFLAMAKDIRVVVIKLADRLHNMRTLGVFRKDKQQRIARETIEIYAPLAHRLGIYNIKWELEDLCFHYLHPDEYYDLVRQMKQKRKAREEIVNDTMRVLHENIEKAGIQATITGRPKHFYSIYKKMKRDGKDLSQIYDLYAVRVIVDTIPQCYAILGIVHTLWKPLPNRFKDYIAVPKPNMYQSLHTTVIGTKGQPVEIQIRTWEMHYTAEYGIAAHWKYKLGMGAGGKGESTRLAENIEKVKNMILDQLEAEDVTDIAKNIRNDFEENDVYVFTPKGDVMVIPNGSTPIDLAYIIHTQVGHRMVGAKVNGKIVPIDYKLKTGEICEIITQKEEHPNKAWIDICKTASAKSKIRQWYKHEKRDENIAEGKQMLEKEFKRNGINLSDEEFVEFIEKMLMKKQYVTLDDVYAAIGYGGIQLWKVMPRIKEEYQKTYAADIEKIEVPQAPRKKPKASSGVVIEGTDDVLVKFSNCCNPLPGDEIIGYITRGYGVSIHKRECTNVPKNLNDCEEPERWVTCYWEDKAGEAFRSTLQIIATDRTGLLADVTIKLSNMHIFIHSLNSREVGDGKAMVTATIDVTGKNHLKGVISKLSDISGIIEIKRL